MSPWKPLSKHEFNQLYKGCQHKKVEIRKTWMNWRKLHICYICTAVVRHGKRKKWIKVF